MRKKKPKSNAGVLSGLHQTVTNNEGGPKLTVDNIAKSLLEPKVQKAIMKDTGVPLGVHKIMTTIDVSLPFKVASGMRYWSKAALLNMRAHLQ